MSTIIPETTPTLDVTYYYGKCAYGAGVKFHTGHEVVAYTRDDSIFAVKTYCGNQIFQENEGQRPPDVPTDELCKSCYRSFAWAEMQKSLAQTHEIENALASDLDDLARRVESNELNDIGIVRALREKAESLRRGVQSVTNGGSKPALKLVSNTASA